MWLGPQFSCHQWWDQPEVWQVNFLAHGWLAGQLQLGGWLSNKMSTWPTRQRHLVAKCDTTSPLDQIDLWSDAPQAETSYGQVWYCCTFRSDWPLVRWTSHQRHLVPKCDTTASLGQIDLWSNVPLRTATWKTFYLEG